MDQPADQQGSADSARRSGSWHHADRGAEATAAPLWPQALGSVLSFSKAPIIIHSVGVILVPVGRCENSGTCLVGGAPGTW